MSSPELLDAIPAPESWTKPLPSGPDERIQFESAIAGAVGGIGGIGMIGGAHAGAQINRLLGDWNHLLGDANDDWIWDADRMSARAWNLIQNDPHARALVECVLLGVLGAGNDLELRSQFELPDEGNEDATTDQEIAWRKSIQNAIGRVSIGTQLDAGDALTRRDLLAQLIVSMVASGDGWAIRVWKPRAGAYQATRWRVIDPARVSNPDNANDSDVLYQGCELDADGCVVAIHIRDRHPLSMRGLGEKPTWTRVSVVAEDGSRNVIHLFRALRAGQIRGFSWFAPLLILAQHLSKLFEAFVIAKRAGASQPVIVKTDNIAECKAALSARSYLGPNIQFRPGMVAITHKDNDVVLPTMQFNGQDYQAFIDTHLRAFAACWGYPFQYVLQQLTEANLASAQVSLDQVDKVNVALQDLIIAQAVTHIDAAIIAEEIARQRLGLPTDDMAIIMQGQYRRPRKPDANRERTRNAAQKFVDLGGSFSTGFSEMGYDFEDETDKLAENIRYMRSKGIPDELIIQRFSARPAFAPTATGGADRTAVGELEKKPGGGAAAPAPAAASPVAKPQPVPQKGAA